jgi:type IV pilus assembly protein PilC
VPIYAYQGQSVKGRKVKGEVEAIDAEDAKVRIRQLQVIPLQVTQIKTSTFKKIKGPSYVELLLAPKIGSRDLQIFTRQFSTLLNSGINIGDSLKILESGTGTPLLRQVLSRVRYAVEGGKSLGDALAIFPLTFDNFYCNMVRAGEVSGSLDQILGRMSTYLEKSEKIKRQVKSAMMYPVIIVAVTVLVISGILVFVIPKFQEMYTSSGSELPALTRIVISLSEGLRKKWFLLLVALVAIPASLIAFYRTDEGKRSVDQLMMGVPVFGQILIKSSVARFTRTMSTLLSSGVPLLDAIEAAAKTVGNVVMEVTLIKCRESVAEGKGFAKPLSKLKIMPQMVSQMVMIGEQTGALDTMLGKVADFFEDEVDNAIKGMATLIEPLLLVVVGGIVAVIVIAMYLPIFGMADVVGKGQ